MKKHYDLKTEMIFWQFLDSIAPNGLGLDVLCDCACLPSHLSCVTILCNLIDPPGDPPGSSVHRILQARILEWVAISFCRGSSWPRDWTHISHLSPVWSDRFLTSGFFTTRATWEARDWCWAKSISTGSSKAFLFKIGVKIPLQCCVSFCCTTKCISYTYIPNSVDSFHPPLSPSLCPHFHSMFAFLFPPANRFICTIFLDSIYMH